MPHTIHLAAIKVNPGRCMDSRLNCRQLLEVIGAILKSNGLRATSQNGNYQDSINAPLSRTHNNKVAFQDEGDPLGDVALAPDSSGHILLAIDKVSHQLFVCTHIADYDLHQLCKIVQAIQSSPQHKQAWMNQLKTSPHRCNRPNNEKALMLILDVKTRWSSTHQMLRVLHHITLIY